MSSTPLSAKSPYELRVNLGAGVGESDVRTALATGDMGFIHSFTTGSAVDGPGIRVVAWTAGCQWRCLYCHNPDTWTMRNGIPVTVHQATEELSKYKHGLAVMRGGFTLSGGEPLMQDRFAVKLLTAAHGMGIHTALDTNGFLGDRLSDEDLGSVDLVLLDLKAMTPELHHRLTKVDNQPIQAFARRLAVARKPIWVRFVVVPGWTDDMAEIERIAAFAAELGNVERVDVLPFHQMGRFKWEKLGMDYQLKDAQPPARATMDEAIARFRSAGLKAV